MELSDIHGPVCISDVLLMSGLVVSAEVLSCGCGDVLLGWGRDRDVSVATRSCDIIKVTSH